MSDYIKRDDAMDAWYWNERYTDIEGIPAADVVEREQYESMERTVKKLTDAVAKTEQKHGEWGKTKQEEFLRCSACDGFVLLASISKDFNYCPNCGARMDGAE